MRKFDRGHVICSVNLMIISKQAGESEWLINVPVSMNVSSQVILREY